MFHNLCDELRMKKLFKHNIGGDVRCVMGLSRFPGSAGSAVPRFRGSSICSCTDWRQPKRNAAKRKYWNSGFGLIGLLGIGRAQFETLLAQGSPSNKGVTICRFNIKRRQHLPPRLFKSIECRHSPAYTCGMNRKTLGVWYK